MLSNKEEGKHEKGKQIVEQNYFPTQNEIIDLLKMTEFFLQKNFFQTHSLKFPPNRANLLSNLKL